MSATLPFLLCVIGVWVLFHLDQDKHERNSKALWLPVIWMCLAGTKSVTSWLGIDQGHGLQGTVEGSPLDAAVFAGLLLICLGIVLSRREKTAAYLPVIIPILVYSAYCLISATWAFYPLPAFKRWTKDAGDVVVALIVVTDRRPLDAVRRLISRVGFLLLPLSIVLIRYTTLGRGWDAEGKVAVLGVTDNKNTLGLICFVVSLGTFWNFRWLLMNRDEPNWARRLAAQGILLACGLYLLSIAHSSTSLACFALGSGLILATHLRVIRKRPSRVHLLSLTIIFTVGSALVFGGLGDVAGALGRDSSFTGRTFMWSAMLDAVSNPLVGVGFDSFWTSPNAESFHHALNLLSWRHPEEINEAHNGYLEVFLNLGWIGLSLLATILITGYMRACRAFARNRELGGLFLAYICTGMIYGITEAGFRTLSPNWLFILLAAIGASGVNAGLIPAEPAKYRAPRRTKSFRMHAQPSLDETSQS